MTTLTQLDLNTLLTDSARDRMASMGTRRGLGGVGAPSVKYSFEGGLPDPSTYPMEQLADVTRRVLMTDRMALNYGGIMGFDGMRDAVIELERPQGGRLPERDNIMITSGASQALHLIYSALLNPGDTVLLEESSYIAQQVKMYGPRVVSIPMDQGGPRIEAMRQSLDALAAQGIRPKFFYTVTGFHNPLGITFSRQRLEQLLRLAMDYGFLIVEDDPYSRIRFSGDDVPSLYSLDPSGQYVVRVGTVSKILGAGLRTGWVIASPDLLRAFMQFKQDGGTNPFAQRVAAKFLHENMWPHIKVVTASYLNKRNVMMGAMAQYCKDLSQWNAPEGGIFLWVKLHEDVDDQKLNDLALQEGVAYRPGSAFNSDGGGKGLLRLAYSFQDPETIAEGIKRLGRAMHAAAD
ncbi:MAG: PLP-dependent aminotransferase family protein [Chloroflexi bacterium]|nr:PLP-dependent aminotransferase family protein [Chloroflexota bacterium]